MTVRTGDESSSRRRRILVSAYACGPGDEPEASAGWAFAQAAARDADVWIITRTRFSAAIGRALEHDAGLAAHITVTELDLPPVIQRFKRGSLGVYWYYALWQSAFVRRARKLHRELEFDVVHHVTFANDWMPAGAARLDIPLVWGPVGGSSRVPLGRTAKWLGIRGFVTELARIPLTGIPRALFGDAAARRASVVIAQNPDVAHRFRKSRNVIVEPNAAFRVERESTPRDPRTAVLVARLLAWKGGRIAIAALAEPGLEDWRLEIFGDGYERRRLEGLARRFGVAERVVFHGHRPRTEVLAALRRATVLAFPSLHDQAGWAAAEASALGCPVVCFPLGGPPTLAERNGTVVALNGDLARTFATGVLEAARAGGSPHDRWSPDRLPAVVASWYNLATGRASA